MDVKINKLNSLVFCAFCCAVTCVLAMIAVPIGPVPITLATVGPYLSGGLLGAKLGALSQLLYLFLVFVGLPFTASLKSGLPVFLGATGGYLIGYVFMAMVVGFFYRVLKLSSSNPSNFKKFVFMMFSCIVGTIFCYAFGLVHFMFVVRCDFFKAFLICVVPFIIGDLLKICVVSFVVLKLERFVIN